MSVEEVLVVLRSVLEAEELLFQGFCSDVKVWGSRILGANSAEFISRVQAETDPTFKQIVPYVLMRCDRSFVSYRRGKDGGESRLVGKRTLGIGGHVNPMDSNKGSVVDINFTCQNALAREVMEEVVMGCYFKDKIVGFLNDDLNDVGKVHLGVVHVWTLDHFGVYPCEKNTICDMSFCSVDHLREMAEDFESWSKLLLPYLETF